jgi:hypothetical protein
MTQTQKQWAEWPLLILSLWIFQALELSVLRLPFQNGAVQLTPIIVVYLALTRNWEKLAYLSFIFSFIGSFTVGYSWIIFVSAQFWMGLVAKVFIMGLTIDSRMSFSILTASAIVFCKLLTGFLLESSGVGLSFWAVVRDSIVSAIASGIVAFFAFPVFMAWDDYFNHPHIDASESNPDILK